MLGCIQPISSPMMKRMLGFDCGCCCARAGKPASTTNVNGANRPIAAFLNIMALPSDRNCSASKRPGGGVKPRRISKDHEVSTAQGALRTRPLRINFGHPVKNVFLDGDNILNAFLPRPDAILAIAKNLTSIAFAWGD